VPKSSECVWAAALAIFVPLGGGKATAHVCSSLLFLTPATSSLRLISEDAEYGLWTVTIFRKFSDDFRNTAREKKYVVWSYVFSLHLIFSTLPSWRHVP
jgi:hypothetical protein